MTFVFHGKLTYNEMLEETYKLIMVQLIFAKDDYQLLFTVTPRCQSRSSIAHGVSIFERDSIFCKPICQASHMTALAQEIHV